VVCSNKHPRSGHAELERLGWSPAATFFADAFSGAKSVGAVLEAMALDPSSVIFVGDTDHDRTTARDAGCRFVLAGWNPRAVTRPGDEVASVPAMVLDACEGQLLV
jgi:phosphoglycolate phosphatase-like HAD superfamily hydrolase